MKLLHRLWIKLATRYWKRRYDKMDFNDQIDTEKFLNL